MEQIHMPTNWWDTVERDREGGGPGRGKDSKQATGYTNEVNM